MYSRVRIGLICGLLDDLGSSFATIAGCVQCVIQFVGGLSDRSLTIAWTRIAYTTQVRPSKFARLRLIRNESAVAWLVVTLSRRPCSGSLPLIFTVVVHHFVVLSATVFLPHRLILAFNGGCEVRMLDTWADWRSPVETTKMVGCLCLCTNRMSTAAMCKRKGRIMTELRKLLIWQ